MIIVALLMIIMVFTFSTKHFIEENKENIKELEELIYKTEVELNQTLEKIKIIEDKKEAITEYVRENGDKK